MKMLTFISVISAIGFAKAQINACDQYLGCMKAVQDQEEICEGLNETPTTDRSAKGNNRTACINEVKKIREPLGGLLNDKRKMDADCMVKLKHMSARAGRPDKDEQCQKVLNVPLPVVKPFSLVESEDKREFRGKIRECKRTAIAMQKKCRNYAHCCPSYQICELEYQQTKLHDDIVKIQYDSLLKINECPAKPEPRDKGERKGRKGKTDEDGVDDASATGGVEANADFDVNNVDGLS